jgi:hypothetical protein
MHRRADRRVVVKFEKSILIEREDGVESSKEARN